MKIKNIIWFILYNNKKWKLKNIIWFILYSNKKWKLKILFNLYNIVIVNENYKYYLIYFI